jgi:hypothetical protein
MGSAIVHLLHTKTGRQRRLTAGAAAMKIMKNLKNIQAAA